MRTTPGPNARRYLETARAAIESDLGGALPLGTTVVPADDRTGSRIATCYPFGDRSAVWCDPEIVEQLKPTVGSLALSADSFIADCVSLGAAVRGIGLNHVLDGPLLDQPIDLGGVALRSLDRENTSDVALISALRTAVDDDEADEAELDVNALDPHIIAAIEQTDDKARILAFSSARLANTIPFDDIAVITHPAARRRGLGAACVHRLIESRQASGTPPLYRCDAKNTGSASVANRLGFDLVQVVGSVRFGA